MSSTYTPSLTLTQIGNGEQSGTWGTTTNTNWQLVEDSVAGVATVSVSGTSGATLSVANGVTDQSRKAVIVVTGSTSGTNAIIAPLQPKVYVISNQTTGGFAITIGATTGSIVTIPSGVTTLVYCDGTNFSSGITGFTGGNLSISGTINATGTITGANFATSGGVPQLAGGATGQIPYQTGANATAYTPAPTTGSYLSWNGTAYVWSTGSVTTATNLAGGSANSVPYQTSAGNTSFLTPTGATPLTLQYNGSTLNWAAAGAVSSFSASGTGLTPSTPTTGAITLGGTLNVANGGTGVTSSTGSGSVVLSASPTFTGTVGAAAISTTGAITASVSSGYASLQSNAVGIGTASNSISSTGAGSVFNFNVGGTLAAALSSTQFVPSPSGTLSLGSGGLYWTTVYATNGTINTSDGTQKQQVAELTTAEVAVARTLKGLIRTFKFNDSVAEKGNGARIHTGVIAQDVYAAFAAQGLDAERYGLFCSDTWYEVDGKVLDEDGNKYTLATTGAVEITRLGIRYDELLAFIIAGL